MEICYLPHEMSSTTAVNSNPKLRPIVLPGGYEQRYRQLETIVAERKLSLVKAVKFASNELFCASSIAVQRQGTALLG